MTEMVTIIPAGNTEDDWTSGFGGIRGGEDGTDWLVCVNLLPIRGRKGEGGIKGGSLGDRID